MMRYFDGSCEDACGCDCVLPAAAHSRAPQLKTDSTNLSWRENSKLAGAGSSNISHIGARACICGEGGGQTLPREAESLALELWGFPRTATSPHPSEDCCELFKPPDGSWRAAPMHVVSVRTLRAFLHHQTVDIDSVMLEAGLLSAPSNLQPKSLASSIWAFCMSISVLHQQHDRNRCPSAQPFAGIQPQSSKPSRDQGQDAGVLRMHWAQPEESQRGPALWPSHCSTSWRKQWRRWRRRWWWRRRGRRRQWGRWWWWRRQWRTREQWQLHLPRLGQDQGGPWVPPGDTWPRTHEGGHRALHQYEVQVSTAGGGGVSGLEDSFTLE